MHTTIICLFSLCPKLNQYRKEFFASESWKQHYNEITEPLMAKVEKALGLTYKLSKSFINHFFFQSKLALFYMNLTYFLNIWHLT